MKYSYKFHVVLLAKRHLKNWLRVLMSSLKGRSSDVIFRDGITFSKVKDAIGLVLLKDRGYMFNAMSEDELLVSKLNLQIFCRITKGFDFSHIYEIFESETYEFDCSNNIIFDIGASNADSSIYFAVNGAKLVIGLEPLRESYELGKKNILKNNLEDRIIFVNSALSLKSGTTTMSVSSQNPNSNSLSPTNAVMQLGIKFDSQEEVKTTSIEALLSEYNLPQIDLLKMDCEGCEYAVLENLLDSTFKVINRIVLEYHDGLKFIPKLLVSKGFNVEYEKKKGLGIIKAWKK